MKNDYLIVIEYKIKLTSSVSYQKRYYYVDETIDFIENEAIDLMVAFSRIGYFPISSSIYYNNGRLVSSKDYEYARR